MILSLADERIDSPETFKDLLSRLEPDRPVKAVVQRGRAKYLITLSPEG